MEKGGRKIKVLVAHARLSHKDVRRIKDVLERESSKATPTLFILHEFFHKAKRAEYGETPITIKHGKFVVNRKSGKVTKYDAQVLANITKLQELAKNHNAYLLYAGRERAMGEPIDRNSAFLLTPAGPAIVRRKIQVGPLTVLEDSVADKSVKVLNINGFHVLPLICYEFGGDYSLNEIRRLLDKRFENTVSELARQNNWSKDKAKKHLSKTMPFYTKGVDIVAVSSEFLSEYKHRIKYSIAILKKAGLINPNTVFANTGMHKPENAILSHDGQPLGSLISIVRKLRKKARSK